MRIDGAIGKLLSGFDLIAVIYPDTGRRRDDILPLFFFSVADDKLLLLQGSLSGKPCHDRLDLRSGLIFAFFRGSGTGKRSTDVYPLIILNENLPAGRYGIIVVVDLHTDNLDTASFFVLDNLSGTIDFGYNSLSAGRPGFE